MQLIVDNYWCVGTKFHSLLKLKGAHCSKIAMALELKKTKIAKMPGAKKASLELPDIEAGLGAGGLLGGDAGVPCLEGFLGGRDGFSGFDGRVDVGAVKTLHHDSKFSSSHQNFLL